MKKSLRYIALFLVLACLFTTSAVAESSNDLHSNIRNLLSIAMQDRYYFKIEGNESGYVIHIAEEGVAATVLSAAMEMQPRDEWQEFIDYAILYADSISNFIKECGVEQPNLLFLVVDDYEMDTTLLAIYNGKVIFDYAPEK